MSERIPRPGDPDFVIPVAWRFQPLDDITLQEVAMLLRSMNWIIEGEGMIDVFPDEVHRHFRKIESHER